MTRNMMVAFAGIVSDTVRPPHAPTPFFLELCAFWTVAVVPDEAISKHGDRWCLHQPLPVSGAHTRDFWHVRDRVRLRKNNHYWDAANTRNNVVDFLPVEAPATAINLYEAGLADIIWDKSLVPIELLDALSQRPDYHKFNYLGSYFVRFNTTKKPLDDPRIRKAMALAIDKARVVAKYTKGGVRMANHFVPPGTATYTSPSGLTHDPISAKRLLAEAGFPNGKGFPSDFEYLFNSGDVNRNIAVELQRMWHENLGIQVKLRQAEHKVFLSEQGSLNYHFSRSSWVGDYNDPNTFLDLFMTQNGNNRTGWSSHEYDRLIRLANTTTDPVKRNELFYSAETILVADELPIFPLFFYVGINIYHPDRIGGIHPNILDIHPIRGIYRKEQHSTAKK